ncbi:hypothetical protein D3C73_1226810 [compost metagenome]
MIGDSFSAAMIACAACLRAAGSAAARALWPANGVAGLVSAAASAAGSNAAGGAPAAAARAAAASAARSCCFKRLSPLLREIE